MFIIYMMKIYFIVSVSCDYNHLRVKCGHIQCLQSIMAVENLLKIDCS